MASRQEGNDAPPDDRRPGFAPSAADIAAYLAAHPDFLDQHEHLIPLLTPPRRRQGENVLDLQQHMLERLRAETARLKLQQRALISTSRSNLTSQQRIHAATLAIVAAGSREALVHVVCHDLSLMLDVDVVALCLEAEGGRRLQAAGPVSLAPGTVDRLIGPGREALLATQSHRDPQIFGAAAGLVKSKALLRVSIANAPAGLLALGSRRAATFKPGQGTELLGFMAQMLGLRLAQWPAAS